MQNGFRIGLLPTADCRSSRRNCPSALEHSQVVSEFLQQQVAAGYMMGPFDLAQCSRVTVNLSSTTESSVNDQTHWELTHVRYVTQITCISPRSDVYCWRFPGTNASIGCVETLKEFRTKLDKMDTFTMESRHFAQKRLLDLKKTWVWKPFLGEMLRFHHECADFT